MTARWKIQVFRALEFDALHSREIFKRLMRPIWKLKVSYTKSLFRITCLGRHVALTFNAHMYYIVIEFQNDRYFEASYRVVEQIYNICNRYILMCWHKICDASRSTSVPEVCPTFTILFQIINPIQFPFEVK